jgi:hypothetical protein
MSTSQGQGGGKKPGATDDRTLLDPLSDDELRALREARQKSQQKKGGAVAHQIVIGPDTGEGIGDAPTRAMPSLPAFDGRVSLEQLGTGSFPQQRVSGAVEDPAARAKAPVGPSVSRAASGPAAGAGPVAGPTGFGENTLLWMAPPKPQSDAQIVGGAAAIADVLPKATPKEIAQRRLRAAGMVLGPLLIVGALVWATIGGGATGAIELHTNPAKAQVKINGSVQAQLTPVRLSNLSDGDRIEVVLDGHQPFAFDFVARTDGSEEAERKDIELDPISQPGKLTVSIEVQPVSANITVDGVTRSATRILKIPNLDPAQPHRITVEAGGYVKVDQEIPAGALKPTYTFSLQSDGQKP